MTVKGALDDLYTIATTTDNGFSLGIFQSGLLKIWETLSEELMTNRKTEPQTERSTEPKSVILCKNTELKSAFSCKNIVKNIDKSEQTDCAWK